MVVGCHSSIVFYSVLPNDENWKCRDGVRVWVHASVQQFLEADQPLHMFLWTNRT
jgi:hypothetical protein